MEAWPDTTKPTPLSLVPCPFLGIPLPCQAHTFTLALPCPHVPVFTISYSLVSPFEAINAMRESARSPVLARKKLNV